MVKQEVTVGQEPISVYGPGYRKRLIAINEQNCTLAEAETQLMQLSMLSSSDDISVILGETVRIL